MILSKERADLLELNRDCHCFPIQRCDVEKAIFKLSDQTDMADLLETRTNYFASTAVFLSTTDIAKIQSQINAIESVISTKAYQNHVYERSKPAHLSPVPNTQGAFMGYDFHMTTEGPRLIEINSNAGGAFIVTALEQAIGKPSAKTEAKIADMFRNEWRLSGHAGVLKTIAIVDEMPKEQFHYPDMCLAADGLRRQGFEVIIADPASLKYEGGVLKHSETPIDLVYNRLTDFTLEQSVNVVLRQAWLNNHVVITPDPRHHALHADKRNLILMSDEALMKTWNIPKNTRQQLSLIPRTIDVTPDTAENLWKNRRDYFFKPQAGFGSRAVYKGAKLTTKTWQHILKGGYVAQAFIRPPVRAVGQQENIAELKYDVRVYTYAGQILLMAARVYQGQVTNLRTEGGGLAPVIELAEAPELCMTK